MEQLLGDSETPAHGQQVITACALIHRMLDGVPQVFIAKRAATKKFLPGVFELPGGHIDFGEDLIAGLKREIHEEFSMNIRVGEPFAAFSYHNPIKGSHSIEVVYFAVFESSISEIQLQPGDHSEYRWIGLADLPSIFSGTKGADDDEYRALRRGLEMIAGARPAFS